MSKPNRYMLEFQGPGGIIDIEETAWTAEDAITQARYTLDARLPHLEDMRQFKLRSVQPWTPEACLALQDRRLRAQTIEAAAATRHHTAQLQRCGFTPMGDGALFDSWEIVEP